MKIDRITGKDCLTSSEGIPAPDKRRIVLFADFLPDETDASIAASDLVVAAQASGVDITSATFASESFAQISLSCRTPMYFERARQELSRVNLADADALVILLDSFMRAEATATSRYRRFKERRRILLLLAEILHLRPDATVVSSGAAARGYLTTARALSTFRFGGFCLPEIRSVKELLDTTIVQDLGLRLPPPNTENRSSILQTHADHGLGRRRLTPQTLLAKANTTPHVDDLRFLMKIATKPEIKGHPTLRWLRTTSARQADVHDCPAPHRLLKIAQELAPEASKFDLPITRYMMHLHTVLNLEREFPLTSPAKAQAYVDWFGKRCAERVPARWVPLPPATRTPIRDGAASGTRADRAARIVLRILDACQASDDSEMLDYLASNPAGIGPSRFAILLAALCQIPVRVPAGRPVWKSEDIRNWFEATACRVIPLCRQFSTASAPPQKSTRSLRIYGLANGKTGLGANSKMAARMAADMRIPFAIHDVDGAEPPSVIEPVAGCRRDMTRDVVLHQVNADRIPLTIMSPELARRNDVFHIGFLLWELDRIPQAHRLGIGMLDEIWAPSRFVADLYSAQTSTPVHMVKKGLVGLDHLRDISARKPDSSGRFTAMACFDFHSSVERKNPLAAVRAFRIAFPQHSHGDCRLIVKTTPTCRGHWGDPADQIGQIRKLAARDSRIEIVESFVSQIELWHMMHSATCILSTHRAEGFGYIPAYALALARPLVSTDYGGPRDFCDTGTSIPVAAPLVEVPEGHALYSPAGSKWADVAPEAVAEALRRVYDDPEMAAARALLGQKRMARDYSMSAFTAHCRQRLEQIGAL